MLLPNLASNAHGFNEEDTMFEQIKYTTVLCYLTGRRQSFPQSFAGFQKLERVRAELKISYIVLTKKSRLQVNSIKTGKIRGL